MLKYPAFWQHKTVLSYLLMPLSYLYILAGKIRRYFAKPVCLMGKVICIGNISVGGTGKTQVAKWLAKKLKDANFKVVIICKNYNGKLKNSCIVKAKHTALEVGDEAKYLSQFCTTIAATNIKACQQYLFELSPDFVILDDFLQNPHVEKNLAILVADASRMFGNGHILPAGPLRQHLEEALPKICAAIFIGNSKDHPVLAKPTFSASISSKQTFDLSKKYLAFAGIGNTQRFFDSLQAYGLKLAGQISFPDHHNYSLAELTKLQNEAKKLNAELITTPKDAIKLSQPVLVFEPELTFGQNQEHKIMQIIYEESKKNTLFY